MSKYVEMQEALKLLNAPSKEQRLENLKKLLASEENRPACRFPYYPSYTEIVAAVEVSQTSPFFTAAEKSTLNFQ
jgi:hypothetical protein